uniref:NADH dehydrogenase subunit 6 n=1 Tax=Priotyrannus closteroides TaxID=584594 RepID=UPI002001BCBC|nr:NADH dehydrogenase subunit 6 [Priotyrannus closteroides]UNZ12714.1 NADH dehydrogenase subunit 6 [Priotyrannus closteroides]
MLSTPTLLLITLSIMFPFFSHPLSFGLILLLQTTLISIITGIMNFNFWFSYILFLIMVGGMLILFIYMTSIASNEKFKFSSKLFITTTALISILLVSTIADKFLLNTNMITNDIINQNINSENTLSMTKYMNQPSSSNLIMIMIYLLITLIMVTKITNIQYGPLRQMF